MQFFQELYSRIDKNSGKKFKDMFFVKITSERTSLIAQKLLLHGEITKVLSQAHVCLLEQIARNAHDQSEETLR